MNVTCSIRMKFVAVMTIMVCCATHGYTQESILFIRGGDRSGGFLEAKNDAGRTEQLADIFNTSTSRGNHGWSELRLALEGGNFSVAQQAEGSETTSGEADGIPLDFADSSDPLYVDLSQWDVVVFGSNNADYSADTASIEAFHDYIFRGGAALFISDANFGANWADASDSDQPFLDRYGIIMHQDRGTTVLQRSAGDFLVPEHPILEGVDAIDGEGVTPGEVSLNPPSDVTIQRIIRAIGSTRLNTPPFDDNQQGPGRSTNAQDATLLIAEYGTGRIALHYDRNTFFNLNGAGTNINRYDNRTYALNLFSWLADAGEEGLSYDSWAATMLTGNLSGRTDDPDRDGFPNVIEYALGQNPEERDSLFDIDNSSVISIDYPRNELATDVDLQLQLSSDLSSWQTFDEGSIQTQGNDGSSLRRFTTSNPNEEQLFFRFFADTVGK